MSIWETMSDHVFRVVSGAPSSTFLTSLWLATAGHTAVFGQAKFRLAGVGFVFLGIPMYSHVAMNSFLKFGQGGLVDCSRRWPAIVSRIRPWGFRCFGQHVFELIPQDSEHCTNRQGRLGACQGKPGWISVAQGFRPFGHVGFELISQVCAMGTHRLASTMACSRFLRSGLGIPMLQSTCL